MDFETMRIILDTRVFYLKFPTKYANSILVSSPVSAVNEWLNKDFDY